MIYADFLDASNATSATPISSSVEELPTVTRPFDAVEVVSGGNPCCARARFVCNSVLFAETCADASVPTLTALAIDEMAFASDGDVGAVVATVAALVVLDEGATVKSVKPGFDRDTDVSMGDDR